MKITVGTYLLFYTNHCFDIHVWKCLFCLNNIHMFWISKFDLSAGLHFYYNLSQFWSYFHTWRISYYNFHRFKIFLIIPVIIFHVRFYTNADICITRLAKKPQHMAPASQATTERWLSLSGPMGGITSPRHKVNIIMVVWSGSLLVFEGRGRIHGVVKALPMRSDVC